MLPERIEAKIDRTATCWRWTAASRRGYGQVWWHGRVRQAHVVVYGLLVGPVPEGLELDHTCQTKGCVNPAHLEPVTHAVNSERGGGAIAMRRARTACPEGHPYDDLTPGARRCTRCRRARMAEASRRYRAKGAA